MKKNTYRDAVELSHYEEETILPKIINILKQCKGKDHALTNKNIVSRYGATYREMEPTIRKVINYIRNQGLIPCLLATNNGYYIATTAKEITDYEESLYGRERAIRKIRFSIHEQGIEYYGEDAMNTAALETKEELDKQKKYKLALKRKQVRKVKKKRKSVLRLKPRKKRYF